MAIVEFKDVSRVYTSGEHQLRALDGVDMSIDEGKFVVILGPSGAGKSTMLNLLGGLDSPTEGRIIVGGRDISTLSNDELAEYRADTVGFVFQFYNLVPTLTVKENVALVKEITKDPLPAEQMLKEVGLEDHLNNFPSELSGGEQQRAALAKVLLTQPQILLLDEPTKGLDSFFKVQFARILRKLMETGMTIVMVSHDVEFCAEYADTVSMFFDGQILTTNTPRRFFGQNSFYTTAANRMSRCVFRNAVTAADVTSLYQANMREES